MKKVIDIEMHRLVVPRHETLRAKLDEEFAGSGPVLAAAHKALDDAAAVRAIKDYVAEVEHPLQHQLFVLHQQQLERFTMAAATSQDVLFTIGSRAIDMCTSDAPLVDVVPVVRQLLEAFLDAWFLLSEQELVLTQLRVFEQFCCEVGSELKWAGSAQVDSARKFDDALVDYMKARIADGHLDLPMPVGHSTPSVERDHKKFLLEDAAKRWTTPLAIQRVSYRPYDPDAVFPPNLCLSRPNARSLKPSDITTDICCVCTNVISEYAKAAPRAHCLDCDNGYNAICGPCHLISQAAVGSLLSGLALGRRHAEGTLVWENLIQRCLRALECRSPHIFHHMSGVTEHCMSYTHANVAQRYANLQQTITSALDTYQERPMFGIVIDQCAVGGLEEPVTLSSSIEGCYRQWTMVHLSPPVGQQDNPTALLPSARKTSIRIPLKCPIEDWRVPSPPILEAARRYAAPPDGVALTTKWLTFGEVRTIVEAVHAQIETLTDQCGDRVALSVGDSPLWYSVELGIIRARRCAVGLFPLWEARDIVDGMHLSKASVALIDVGVFSGLVSHFRSDPDQLPKLPKRLVVFVINNVQEVFVHDAAHVLGEHAVKVVFVQQLATTQSEPHLWWFPPADPPQDVSTKPTAVRIKMTDDQFPAIAVFTSGTSGGKPKGVTTTTRQFQLECVDANRFYGICDDSISAYAPSWATDKHNVWRSVLRGGRVHFHCKTRSIFESLGEARPTPAMSLVPFLANQLPSMLEAVAADETNRLTRMSSGDCPLAPGLGPLPGHNTEAVRRAIQARAYATATYHMVEHLLGGRVYILSVGGASVRADVLSFLRRNTPCYVMENYGLTECGGVLRDNMPFPGSLVKLIDRPDLGYCTTDTPYPRGEFAVKSSDIATIGEWICDADAAEGIRARYLPDGYFLTGDIGLQRPDGSYEVIDRASAVRKLANGKFFSPERVEQTVVDFAQSLGGLSSDAVVTLFPAATLADVTHFTQSMQDIARSISGCFVAADEDDHSTVRALFQLSPARGDPTALSSLVLLVKTACALRGIPRDEVPVECFIESDAFEWSAANGCLTASRKPNRRALMKRIEAARASSTAIPQGSIQVGGGTPVTDVDDVAVVLVQCLVPNPPAVSRGAACLSSLLTDLGCDSLVLSRIPRLLGPTLQRVRGSLCASLPPAILRDLSQLPNSFLTTPSLMRQTPRSIALAVWNAEAAHHDDAPNGQPFFSRQSSTVLVSGDAPGDAMHAMGMAIGTARDDSVEGMPPTVEETGRAVVGSSTTIPGASGSPSPVHHDQPSRLDQRISEIEVDASAELQRVARAWVVSNATCRVSDTNCSDHSVADNATVLLTGAAGYYGSCVLYSLLEAPWCTRVFCVVRPSRNGEPPLDRLVTALSRLAPQQARPSLLASFYSKAQVLEGDLEQPWFGMGVEAYDSVFRCHHLDAIIHAAAVVKSWSLDSGLEALRGANVDATVRIAQLAIHNAAARRCRTPTPIVYVSTVSVMKSQDVTALDNDVTWKLVSEFNDAALGYYDAYSATKLMAENVLREWCLVLNAPLRIFRLPLMTWHTQTGAENNDDWMNRLLDGVLSTRLAPLSNAFVEGTNYAPVDTAAAHLVRITEALIHQGAEPVDVFKVVYPFNGEKVNIRSVLRIVEEELAEAVERAQTTLLLGTVPQEEKILLSQRILMGKLLWVPAYAWKSGLDALTLTLPTRYHPLLEKGVLELQRAAGVRPIHPQGLEEAAAAKEIDVEALQDNAWVLPLRMYLREVYFRANP